MNRLPLFLPILLAFVLHAKAENPSEQKVAGNIPLSEWPARESLKRMQAVMGGFPQRHSIPAKPKSDVAKSLDMRVDDETDLGNVVRKRISYQSEPGNRVPAYLLVPKAAIVEKKIAVEPAPAVLCLHPTNIELGAKVAVGMGGAPNRAYALELAQRGFVTLAPCYPTMGGYAPDLEKLGYQSGTMKAIVDNVRGLDLLDTLPYVKHGDYGVIGHSLGGHNALFTAAFDPRITVVVSSCGFDSFRDYYGGDPKMWEAGKGWTQARYMPRLAAYAGKLEEVPFDFDEVIAMLAPRAVFVSAPLGDTNFQWRSVDRLAAAAKPLYEKHNAAASLEVVHPDCDHDFPDAIRERAYQLLEKHLR